MSKEQSDKRGATPETDALFVVLPRRLGAALALMMEHAQKLERERDALKASALSHVGQNADELIRELREWSQQHLAMTAIEIIEEAQALMSKAANALASTPSTTPQKPGSAEDYRAKWLEAIDTITTLGRLEEKLKAERAEIAKLLHETAGMCRMSVFNVHDNRMEEQAKKLNDAAFSLGASVPSATACSEVAGKCADIVEAEALNVPRSIAS